MRLSIYFLCFLFSCQNISSTDVSDRLSIQQIKEEKTYSQKPFSLEEHLANYAALKTAIKDYQKQLQNRTDIDYSTKKKQAKTYLSTILIDSIFPYWMGTRWDFNGYTETPRKGVVACGYFVSTTIRDAGFQINRYRIAQKGATDIIKSLCAANSLQHYSSKQQLLSDLARLNDYEIWIVGLDYHVGFLFRHNGQSYFAHSNYIGSEGVIIELAASSAALAHSNAYVIGHLLNDSPLLDAWIGE